MSTLPEYDIAIIGSGINGAGIARDAAGRGASVFLCDKGDVGGETSANSTKLIHGGLRYLETYSFSLVQKALREREILTQMAPHLIRPMSFVIPDNEHSRPRWLVSLGLFIYDMLASSRLYKPAQSIGASHHAMHALKDTYLSGFSYQDGWVDDHRLVLMNVKEAERRGAHIRLHTECIAAESSAAESSGHGWILTMQSSSGQSYQIRAKSLVNATGPWAQKFLENVVRARSTRKLTLLRGSHIVLPQLFTHDSAYLLQCRDKRVVFAIPYLDKFTLVGTTEEHQISPDDPIKCSTAEAQYLCDTVNAYFKQSVTVDDIVHSYAGVRPLVEEKGASARENSRDYDLQMLLVQNAPLLNIWGGKITTYRVLAEDALKRLKRYVGLRGRPWTHSVPLLGGNIKSALSFGQALNESYPFLTQDVCHRYATTYGALAQTLLKDVHTLDDMGAEITPGVFSVELEYLLREEWARTAEDILFKRTKLGLVLSDEEVSAIHKYMVDRNKPKASVAVDVEEAIAVSVRADDGAEPCEGDGDALEGGDASEEKAREERVREQQEAVKRRRENNVFIRKIREAKRN